MWQNTADLVTFTEKVLNGKLHFLCSAKCRLHFHQVENTSSNLQQRGMLNPLSANPTKWSNTLKQFVGKLQCVFLSVFDHFVKLALKGLIDRIVPIGSCTSKIIFVLRCCFIQSWALWSLSVSRAPRQS